jgi:DNA-binding transcriptional MerR regulator
VLDGFRETLREQGMPTAELQAILRSDDPVIVRRYLELHRERLEERLAEQVRTLERLERQLDPAPDRARRDAAAEPRHPLR